MKLGVIVRYDSRIQEKIAEVFAFLKTCGATPAACLIPMEAARRFRFLDREIPAFIYCHDLFGQTDSLIPLAYKGKGQVKKFLKGKDVVWLGRKLYTSRYIKESSLLRFLRAAGCDRYLVLEPHGGRKKSTARCFRWDLSSYRPHDQESVRRLQAKLCDFLYFSS